MNKINKIISATLLATTIVGLGLLSVNAEEKITQSNTSMQSYKKEMNGDIKKEKGMDMFTSFIDFNGLTDTQKESIKSILDNHRISMENIKKEEMKDLTDIQKEEIKLKVINLHNDLITKLSEYISPDNLEKFKNTIDNMVSDRDIHIKNRGEGFKKMNYMNDNLNIKNKGNIENNKKYLKGKTYNSLKEKLVLMETDKLFLLQDKIDKLIETLSKDLVKNEKKIGMLKELKDLVNIIISDKEDNSDELLNEIMK